jgi:hypothetical protein
VWCGLTSTGLIGPFFFYDETVSGAAYLDMLEGCAVLQVPDGYDFQQDGASPHLWKLVT